MDIQNAVKVRHRVLGVETELPVDAVPHWRAAGWDPVDQEKADELVAPVVEGPVRPIREPVAKQPAKKKDEE